MVECGWDHNVLNEMSEEEFCFWFETRKEYDELIAEAAEARAKSKNPEDNT